MPRGGVRIGAGRPKAKPADSVGVQTPPAAVASLVGPDLLPGETPLAYMLRIINDPSVDESRRDRLAVAAAPYLHPKAGEGGKKEQKDRAAKTAGLGKFAPAAPPKLVSSR